MKRLANLNDKQKLIDLYNTCFKGEKEFCNRFFCNVWKPENTLLIEENGKIISMLQMLPTVLSDGETKYSAYYIYAAATDPDFEGQGKMSCLLNESFKINRDTDYAILIVGNNSLIKFYERFGFSAAFSVSKTEIKAKNLGITVQKTEDFELLERIAESSLKGVFHNKRLADDFRKNLFCSKASAYIYNDSYAILENTDKAIISETLGRDSADLCSQLLYDKNFSSGVAVMPNGKERIGMLKPIRANRPLSGYINTLFN